ncbi:MAG: hypothetical protein JSR86_20525 [Proteobacteria bacterium]|nr:hypothetical protein [Pseudomonadota bacterium]
MTDITHKNTRQSNGRFGAGNPGRPIGSRNRSARVAEVFFDDFEANQDEIIRRLRVAHLRTYMSVITHLMPKLIDVAVPGEDGGYVGVEGQRQP